MIRGTYLVGGKPPVSGNRDIAYMLARDALCPWRTALENAELGAEIRGVPPPERRQRALELLDKVGLKGFENAYPKALSQGMRQRVALARTFSLDAPILLMDEPFGALDAQTKLQLEDVLLSLWQREQRTVVFVTHDLSEAVSMSDRVVVMSARPGRIIADVTHHARPAALGAGAAEGPRLPRALFARVDQARGGVVAVTDRTTTWTTPQIWAGRIAILVVFFLLWEQAAATKFIDPILIGRPSGIVAFLWQEIFVTGSLIKDLGWTMLGTILAFLLGSVCGVLVGMVFVTRPTVEALLSPILMALNAMPRIALAPLFLIWFGLGIGSKIAIGFSLTFFIVLTSTVAGGRGVNPDHITLARTLGASETQIFRKFVLPSAVPVIFNGLEAGADLRAAGRDRRRDNRLRARPRPDADGARRQLQDQRRVRRHHPAGAGRCLHHLGHDVARELAAEMEMSARGLGSHLPAAEERHCSRCGNSDNAPYGRLPKQ